MPEGFLGDPSSMAELVRRNFTNKIKRERGREKERERDESLDCLYKGGEKAFYRLSYHILYGTHEYEVHVGNL